MPYLPVNQEPLLASTTPDIDAETQAKPISTFPPWLPTFGTAALGGFLFGSDIGSSSSVVRILGSAG
jgi:hypothetical protein